MVFDFFRKQGEGPLELIESQIGDMLDHCQVTFGTAMDTLIGGVDPSAVGTELRKTDREINRAERAIRRELVVHVSVRGSAVDIPSVLVYMSIIKDIERIGDYSKNIFDLSNEGIDLSDAPDLDRISGYRQRIDRLIVDTARVFAERDVDDAHTLLQDGDDLLDEYDLIITEQIQSDRPAREAVPRALLFRYFKRITAHLLTVMTAVVMPVDRLDYYDEDKADRE